VIISVIKKTVFFATTLYALECRRTIPQFFGSHCSIIHCSYNRLESRHWTSNLFICDIQSSTYCDMYNFRNNNHKILLVLTFPKCGLSFLCYY